MSKDWKKKPPEESMSQEMQKEPNKIAFTDWFSVRLHESKTLKAHHHDSILAFFKNNNLSEQETEEDYDSMLKKFGF